MNSGWISNTRTKRFSRNARDSCHMTQDFCPKLCFPVLELSDFLALAGILPINYFPLISFPVSELSNLSSIGWNSANYVAVVM